jgi:hypothetical protein
VAGAIYLVQGLGSLGCEVRQKNEKAGRDVIDQKSKANTSDTRRTDVVSFSVGEPLPKDTYTRVIVSSGPHYHTVERTVQRRAEQHSGSAAGI